MLRLPARALLAAAVLAPVAAFGAPAHADDPAYVVVSPGNGSVVSGEQYRIALRIYPGYHCNTNWTLDGADVPGGIQFDSFGQDGGTYYYEGMPVRWGDGQRTLTATCVNYDTGQVDYTASRTFTVRNVRPTIHITSPGTSTVSGDALGVDVEAAADPEVASRYVASVSLSADGQVLSTDTVAPFHFLVDTTKLGNGPHELVATALDSVGLASASPIQALDVRNYTTSIESAADHERIAIGQAVRLSASVATVEDGSAAPAGTATLLVRRIDQAGWAQVSTARVSSSGTATAVDTPKVTSLYMWRYVGDSGNSSSSSSTVTIQVTPRIGLAMPSGARVGAVVAANVSINPAHGGQRVVLQRRTGSATWTTVASATSGPGITSMHVMSPSKAGSYYFRAYRYADRLGEAATSTTCLLRVR